MAKIFSFLLHFHLSIINYMISFIKMLKEKKNSSENCDPCSILYLVPPNTSILHYNDNNINKKLIIRILYESPTTAQNL